MAKEAAIGISKINKAYQKRLSQTTDAMGPATTTAVQYLILCYSITLYKRYRNWHRP
jgi:ABC-type amino acid transport system permease subunit